MYSIAFPKMFGSAKTLLLQDHDAIFNNLKLILNSDRYSMLGDPYFGCLLKAVVFEQNDPILIDLVIDEIYTTIMTFMPQITLKRSDIKIYAKGTDLFADISCIYVMDQVANMYTIKLNSNTVE